MAERSILKLLHDCVTGNLPEDWDELIRRLRPCILGAVIKAARCRGITDPSRHEDLTQDVFAKLLDNNARIVRDFQPRSGSSEPEFFGFISVISSNVVSDHSKSERSQKRDRSREISLDDPDV